VTCGLCGDRRVGTAISFRLQVENRLATMRTSGRTECPATLSVTVSALSRLKRIEHEGDVSLQSTRLGAPGGHQREQTLAACRKIEVRRSGVRVISACQSPPFFA
jgi:Mg-chelatase subunit ChlD